MSDKIGDVLDRLDVKENVFKTLFLEIEYIGEIPLRREDYDQLVRDLNTVQTSRGLTKTTQLLRNRWPHVFVTYLSFTAALNTNRGYWDGVVDDLGITNKSALYTERNHWGKQYLDLLDRFGLDTFSDLESGYPYVTPIRLQGGIPRYSLPDFFEYIVLPTVEDPEMLLLDDRTAFEEVQERSGVQYRVDQVVKLYLQHGGEYAFRFFARTRSLARVAVKKGEAIPSPSELDLRPFVVQLFEEYLERRVERETRRRLHSPRLTFWPHQSTFHLELPEQVIPERYAYRKHEWRIRLYESKEIKKEDEYPVRVFPKGGEIHSKDKELTIEHPYRQAIIEFGNVLRTEEQEGINGKFKVIRRWPIRLLPDPEQPPLMSFDQKGKVIRHTEGLPAGTCWILCPMDHRINIEGEERKIEEKTDYWGSWSDWKSELWDLSGVRLVELMDGSGDNVAVLPVLQPLPTPQLLGENQIAYSQEVNGSRLFIGTPPKIRFPKFIHGEGGYHDGDLANWYLTITSDGLAEPELDRRVNISDHQDSLVEDEASIDFSLVSILGDSPAGTYQIEIYRPNGKVINQSFRVWPKLIIDGLQPLFIPKDEQGSMIDLDISLPGDAYLDSVSDLEDPDRNIKVQINSDQEDESRFSASIPPGIFAGEFNLSYPIEKGVVSVPLVISIPRLRWTILLGDLALQEVAWHSSLQHISLPELSQSVQAVLYATADLPRDTKFNLNLTLVLPESGKELQTLSGSLISSGEPRCSWNLKKFLDTIRPLESEPFFDLVVKVENSDANDSMQIPVVRVSRTIDVREVWLQKLAAGNWVLHWQEPKPLQHRRVRFWSLWQPWHDPIEIKIPNDAPRSDSVDDEDWYMHELPLEDVPLIPGSYAISFIAMPPWEERSLPNYPPDDGVKTFRTVEPESRLSWIEEKLLDEPKMAFALHFERACIFDELGRFDKRDEDISWCSSNIETTSLHMMIEFYDWLEGRDSFTQKALRLRMYQPKWLEKLFQGSHSKEFHREFLSPILEMKNIPAKSARLILKHVDFPELISRSVNQLIISEDEFVIEYILHQTENGKFSALGAFEVMKPKADFALNRLLELQKSTTRSRFLKELSEHTEKPRLIYPGWWIRTDAGWGKIMQIIDKDGKEQDYFKVGVDRPMLDVMLRPGNNAVEIKVDLDEETAIFPGADTLYLCTHKSRCYHFVSDNRAELKNIHNRVAHEGLQPSFLIIHNSEVDLRHDPEYSPDAPDHPYS